MSVLRKERKEDITIAVTLRDIKKIMGFEFEGFVAKIAFWLEFYN